MTVIPFRPRDTTQADPSSPAPPPDTPTTPPAAQHNQHPASTPGEQPTRNGPATGPHHHHGPDRPTTPAPTLHDSDDDPDAGSTSDRLPSSRYTVRIHTDHPDAIQVLRPLLKASTTLLGPDTLTVVFNTAGRRIATFDTPAG